MGVSHVLLLALLFVLHPDDSLCGPADRRGTGGPKENPGRKNGSKFGHWEKLHETNFGGKVPVAKYQSSRTGLRVTIGQLETPIVEVYMCVPTEVWSDDGAPHVLEHLLFQRSRDYPYKNFLRQSAPRFNCGYLNAYTDTDHTCYYFKTAGTDGGLRFMQLYLNQMLYASLTDADILTEAHHINGKGEDGGVVYSEMKGYNSQHWFQMRLKMRDLLFPGNTSYAKNQGGSIEGLRTLTPERIRQYHKKYYNTQNIVIAINGKVDPKDVFEALEPVERRAFDRGVITTSLLERPFATDYPLVEKNIDEEIPLSAGKDEAGRLMLSWRLPWRLWENFYDTYALQNFVSTYLGHTSISPLQETFTQGSDPVSTGASMSVYTISHPYAQVSFTNVEMDKMYEVEPMFEKMIYDLVEGDEFDLQRMRDIVQSLKEKSLASLETSASFSVSGAIKDAIYSRTSENWNEIFDDDFEDLMQQPKEYWVNLINSTFSGPRVALRGVPSEEYRNKLAKEEKARLAKQKAELGEDGLKEKGKKLKDAIALSSDPPASVLETFPLADTQSIRFLPIDSYNYTTTEQPEGFALKEIPFRFHVDNIDSQYVRFSIALNVTDFPPEDWYYVETLAYVWQKSPLLLEGEDKVTELADVIKRKDKTTLEFSTRLIGTSFIEFRCKSSLEKYPAAIAFAKDVLFRVQIDLEKVKNHVDKTVKGFHDWRKSETGVLNLMMKSMLYSDDYPGQQSSYLRTYANAKRIQDTLASYPEIVLDRLKDVHSRMIVPERTVVYLATRLANLTSEYGEDAANLWKNLYEGDEDCEEPTPEELSEPVTYKKAYNYLDKNPKIRRAIAGNHGVEACFVKHRVPFIVEDVLSSDIPSFELAGEIFNLQLRNVIRLHGTAYGGFLSGTASSGFLQFMLYRAQDTRGAYALFKEVLANHTTKAIGKNSPWTESAIKTTKGKLIYNRVSAESTPEGLASVSRSSMLNALPSNLYNRQYVERINAVTREDLERVAEKYLTAFNDADKATIAIVCYPNQVEDVAKALEKDLGGPEFLRVDDIEKSSFFAPSSVPATTKIQKTNGH